MNTVKKRFGSNNSAHTSPKKKNENSMSRFASPVQEEFADLSPELVPIVTLLSSQSHRRYHEGIFMLYYDLNGDGKPADREWKEVYGILTGNQLAYWDAANLTEFRNNPEALLEASSKPNYINFTDAVYNAMKNLPAAKQNLDNVIIVSTTLKNRYLIQFKTYGDLVKWYVALRLANYEYGSLQEAYTGALLSARGSRLSDIRTVLAEKRFDHEDWVSIRYGSGMAWKRCYAVVEPSQQKRKLFLPGRILFYENESMKKKLLMAVVTNASSVTAIYPQSPKLIDHSTMLKLEGYINFTSPSVSTKVSKKHLEDFKNTSIFMMPEEHSSVPGFDTLIRFLIPLLDSFGLYGRPKRLKADRIDPESLLFGLPTLPHVHFLETDDLSPLTTRPDFLSWDVKQWTNEMKAIMKGKLDRGYEGCGSSRGLMGAMTSLSSPGGSNSGSFKRPAAKAQQGQPPQHGMDNLDSGYMTSNSSIPLSHSSTNSSKNTRGLSLNPSRSPERRANPSAYANNAYGEAGSLAAVAASAAVPLATTTVSGPERRQDPHKSIQLADIYQKYSDIKSPSDQFHTNRNQLLNGSHERLIEEELPQGFRNISLNEVAGTYPKNDDELFSEDDENEKLDIRQAGTYNNGVETATSGLELPQFANRNSSYSSVKSPMTQYHEFNEQFSKVVDTRERKPTQAHHQVDFDDDDDVPPSPPPHSYPSEGNVLPLRLPKTKPTYNSVLHGTTTPIKSQGPDHLSIHSETGNAQSADSSPYSEKSDEKYYEKLPLTYQLQDYVSLPSSRKAQPRHIMSPNSSQNHRFEAPAKRKEPTGPPQIVVAPATPSLNQPTSNKQASYQSLSTVPVVLKQDGMVSPQNAQYQRAPNSHHQPHDVAPPQQQSYPQSTQFGYQTPAVSQGVSQNPQHRAGPPPLQKYQQQPPLQSYQQGAPPPLFQPQGSPSHMYQQGTPPQPYHNYPPQNQYRSQAQPGYQQRPPQGAYPQPRAQQSGIPPSVAMQPNSRQQRPQQPFPSQSAASMRGYNGGPQQQFQYQYQVNPQPGHPSNRAPTLSQRQQQPPQGNAYANGSSRNY